MILAKIGCGKLLFCYLFGYGGLGLVLLNYLHFGAIDNDVCLYVRSCTVGGCTKGRKYNRCVFLKYELGLVPNANFHKEIIC